MFLDSFINQNKIISQKKYNFESFSQNVSNKVRQKRGERKFRKECDEKSAMI